VDRGDGRDDGQAEPEAVVGRAVATASWAHAKGWAIVIPADAWAGGLAAAMLIGALAGLLPAIRAARLSPTEALLTV
jgi:putative ABC transport system permease protein